MWCFPRLFMSFPLCRKHPSDVDKKARLWGILLICADVGASAAHPRTLSRMIALCNPQSRETTQFLQGPHTLPQNLWSFRVPFIARPPTLRLPKKKPWFDPPAADRFPDRPGGMPKSPPHVLIDLKARVLYVCSV